SMPSLARGTMLPLVRRVRVAGSDNLLLVALIDPDRFASYQQLAVRDEHTVAVLTSYQGRVIAALPWAPVTPGQRLLGHPLFTDFDLPRERGSLVGPGLRDGTQLIGYRVSRHRPLVVLVEMPRSRLVAQWFDAMLPLLLGRLVITLGLVALTAYAWLALRSHERAQRGQQSVHEAVENRERQLTELFKLVPELIFRVGRDGRVSFVNGRYTDVSGRSAQQAVGQWLPELFLPASREAVAALFDPQRGRTPRRAIGLLGGPYGIERRFDITVVPLYDGDELRGFAGSAVDETERLLLQDKLRGQVEFTARLLELVPVPVSIIDRDGRFMSVNQAWEAFNQRRREEVLGRVAGEHWTQADRQAQRERDEQLLRQGGSDSAELLYTRVDQSRRLVRMNKVAVPGEDGQPVAVLNAFVDLTEFREAERAIVAAREAAEQVSRLKSDFIASVSHELRTPLQSILGFTEIGRQRALDPQRQQALLEEIHRAGQGMLRMVNELLELARLERLPRTGPAALEPAAADELVGQLPCCRCATAARRSRPISCTACSSPSGQQRGGHGARPGDRAAHRAVGRWRAEGGRAAGGRHAARALAAAGRAARAAVLRPAPALTRAAGR
ncbi:PAS domain-containing protein, partial [Piscinibacter sakaiensis]|uniref:PAS domain-containing protein n=1 Tax=Piscinibacter sakaiensis TaxID=1547922 RepID=UPI00372987FB